MGDEANGMPTGGNGAEAGETGIAGTGFKTLEELAAGYNNLSKKLGEQGNELGNLRKETEFHKGQAETFAALLKENMGGKVQEQAPAGPNYGEEINAAKTELSSLDALDPKFLARQAELVDRIAQLTAAAQHEKTLSAAGNMFKQELTARDQQAAKEAFYTQNPDFNTPEMQGRIREFLAKDRTGLHDPMSAFYQIQRDDVAAMKAAIEQENLEYKRLLDLNKGKEEAGKVIVKGQTPPAQETKPAKVTGKDLDLGMLNALRSLK